ncbi:hypothetical protein MNBD_GAMMA03-1166 [hydrothermal vent metagenome]|uniref:Flagellar hook-length control protein-like C-terminal domain-containing protein n=1 Tax=hydrothermal vent metagenome TaxID=652676 RepID=A0A3B0W2M5_9ZZZZ
MNLANMNPIKMPLAEGFSVSNKAPLESTGFSGLFSAMISEQATEKTIPADAQNALDIIAGVGIKETVFKTENTPVTTLVMVPIREQEAVKMSNIDPLTFDLSSLDSQKESLLKGSDEALALSIVIPSPSITSLETDSLKTEASLISLASELIENEAFTFSNVSNEIPSPPIDSLESIVLGNNIPANQNNGASNEQKLDLTPLLESKEAEIPFDINGIQSGLLGSNTANQNIGQNGVTGINQNGGSPSLPPSSASSTTVSWSSQASSGFEQSGQSAQNGAGQQAQQQTSQQQSQQQAMMFAQLNQENKQQSLAQQAAVRAINESIAKAEGREVLGGAEIASLDRKFTLPLGLQTINLPIKHPQWGQALGQRIVFMSNNSLQQAQITLNPQKLGQIQVTLQLDKDQQMHVSLVAQNGVTREAMESALPRLREMMEQAGVTLSTVDVRDQKTFSEHDTSGSSRQQKQTPENPTVEDAHLEERSLSTFVSTNNIVDYYA